MFNNKNSIGVNTIIPITSHGHRNRLLNNNNNCNNNTNNTIPSINQSLSLRLDDYHAITISFRRLRHLLISSLAAARCLSLRLLAILFIVTIIRCYAITPPFISFIFHRCHLRRCRFCFSCFRCLLMFRAIRYDTPFSHVAPLLLILILYYFDAPITPIHTLRFFFFFLRDTCALLSASGMMSRLRAPRYVTMMRCHFFADDTPFCL